MQSVQNSSIRIFDNDNSSSPHRSGISKPSRPKQKRALNAILSNRVASTKWPTIEEFLQQCPVQPQDFGYATKDDTPTDITVSDPDYTFSDYVARQDIGAIPRENSPELYTVSSDGPKLNLMALIPPSNLTPYLPEDKLALGLFHTYFLEVPAARLMFDEQAVIRRYNESSLPQHITLGILAIASLYCRSGTSAKTDLLNLLSAESIILRGGLWADIASQMALMRADDNSITTIRSCEIISMYWYATGDRNRANFHAGVSSRVYRILAKSRKYSPKPWNDESVNSELTRRARYSADSFKMLYPQYSSWLKATSLSRATHTMNRDKVWPEETSSDYYSGARCAVGMVSLWRESMILLRRRIKDSKISDGTILELDVRLRHFHRTLPYILKANSLMDYQLAGPSRDAILCFTALYCASLMCLHSINVPYLTNVAKSGNTAPSERAIIEMAQLAGDIIHEYVITSWKRRSTPAMGGYTFFAIGAIHAHMIEFRDGPGWSVPWMNGVSCLIVLEHMATFWPVLKGLCTSLRKRFSYSDPNMMTISTDLLWQLVCYRSPIERPQTQAYTTGFFNIPHQTSFAHEMFGSIDHPALPPDTAKLNESKARHETTTNGIDQFPVPISDTKVDSQYAEATYEMGSIGTNPPTFNFEANLLGLIEPLYR